MESEARYDILGTVIVFHSNIPNLVNELEQLYSPFKSDSDKVDIKVCMLKFDNQYVLQIGESKTMYEELWQMLLDFKASIVKNFWKNPVQPILLHGGAVSKEGKAIVLIGGEHAGKTMQTLGLVERGFDYIGDEYVLLDLETKTISYYPVPLAIRQDTPNIVGIRDNIKENLYEKFREEIKPLVPPPIKGRPVRESQPHIFLLLQPNFKQPPFIENVSLEDMVEVIVNTAHTYNYEPPMEKAKEVLNDLLKKAKFGRLRIGALDETINLIVEFFEKEN